MRCQLAEPQQNTLLLLLPKSAEPPEYGLDRVPKLTIDGKNEPIKWDGPKELRVKVPAVSGKESVTVVYSFWPVSYSNTIRTKVAKLAKDGDTRIDFHTEDPDRPDQIRPVYFPTPYQVVDAMCKMANVGKDDVVYDIGCGDGRMVIAGVKKFGAKKGVGVEIDPGLVKLCKKNAEKAGVAGKVDFRNEDALLIKDLSDATVVLLYVGDDFGKKLEPVLRKTLKPALASCRIASRWATGNPTKRRKSRPRTTMMTTRIMSCCCGRSSNSSCSISTPKITGTGSESSRCLSPLF